VNTDTCGAVDFGVGADEDALRNQWDSIVEARGIALSAIDDYTYDWTC
jgi:hypothetical protein